MDRPLEVRDTQNVTLKSTDTEKVQPLLVVQFPCAVHDNCLEFEWGVYPRTDYPWHQLMPSPVCCSAVHFRNVSQAHIDGIVISVNSTNVSALVIEHCTDILISSVILTNETPMTEFGLLVYESSKIVVDILQASKFVFGIAAYKSHFISISNTNIHNMSYGVYIVDSHNASVVNVISQSNRYYGILLAFTSHTTMTNSTFQNNGGCGITLTESTFSDVSHLLSDNNDCGFVLEQCTDTFVNGMHASHNKFGFYIELCTNLTIINILVEHTHNADAVVILRATGVMKSVYAYNNQYAGISISLSAMYMENISADYNEVGIELYHSNISMTFASANHNNIGIAIVGSRDTIIMNSSSMRNNGNGVQIEQANNIRIIDSHVIHNQGGDIRLSSSTNIAIVRTVANIGIHKSNHIYLKEIAFFGMSASSTISSNVEPTSLPAIVELYNSNVTVCNCSFTKNTVSVIKAIGSEVTFSGELTFSHNRALTGTALIFVRSRLSLTENCKAFFFENYASNVGGVIYINTEESYVRSITLSDIKNKDNIGSLTPITKCFIRVEGSRSDTRLVFVNNTAGKGGDVLYGGLVALGWDGDWNCLLSFKNISDMSQQSGLSTITSNPSRVCFCKDGEPDCLTVAHPITHHIYPGQTITIPAVVVGQDFGTVTGSVYAKLLNISFDVEMKLGQNVSNINQNQCSSIKYTIFSQKAMSKVVLVLTAANIDISYILNEGKNQELENSWRILNSEPNYNTLASNIIQDFLDGPYTSESDFLKSMNRTVENFYKFTHLGSKYRFIFPQRLYDFPIYITISFLPCPAGFTLTSEKPFKCDFNHQLQHLPTVKCHIQDQTISRSGLVWVGSDGTESVITSQQCPLDYCKQEDINVTLEPGLSV